MQRPVYLDYAATTPLDPRVSEAMCDCLAWPDGNFGNPASRSHVYGWKAEEAVENARNQVAELIDADAREIVWTSGATESDNLAIKGVVEARSGSKALSDLHIITSTIEHKAVLDSCRYLQAKGVQVSFIQPEKDGRVAVDKVLAAITPATVLISLMFVNNETGVINDIADLGKRLRELNQGRNIDQKILLHVDGAQAAGKIVLDVNAQFIDLLSLSAHKMYGPKGIGALYVRRSPELKIAAQIHGGGHERGMRSGTLPTHQIVGFGLAASLAGSELEQEQGRLLGLRNRFLAGLEKLSDFKVNGSLESRIAGNVNISFAQVDGETLLVSLRDLALSTGSACTSASVEPSYVLKAMGVDDELAHGALRISFGRFTTEAEIDLAIENVIFAVTSLRQNAAQPQLKNQV